MAVMSCGFKSHLPHTYSSIAQSVEHAAVNRAVVGSSPTRGVMQKWRNWQTRTVQVRVVVIPCGFDSHLLHWFMEQEAEWLPVFAFPVFFWNPVVSDVFATDKFHHKR